jgi:hypothetical protein
MNPVPARFFRRAGILLFTSNAAMPVMNPFATMLACWLFAVVAACPASEAESFERPRAVVFEASSEVTSRLIDPINIELQWKSSAIKADGYFAGYCLEYTNRLEDDFILLDVFPPKVTRVIHPQLAPETKFLYRIRPIFGKASAVASVTTGAASDEESIYTKEPKKAEPAAAGGNSLHAPSTISQAGPGELAATLVSPRVAQLSWKDCANDEDGYFVESSSEPDGNFKVFAYLEPDTVSYQVPLLPAETKCYFRVWGFFFGKASNLTEQTTGLEPPPRDTALQSEPLATAPAKPRKTSD